MKLNEVILKENLDMIDNRNGIGQTPDNQDIDYMGARTGMTPDLFLTLAKELGATREGHLEYIMDKIEDGEKIGAPMIHIEVPDEWLEGNYNEPARVLDHEGRHRMRAIKVLYGPYIDVETHLFFYRESNGSRIKKLSNGIKDEWSYALNQGIVSQNNRMVKPNILLR